VGVVAALSRRQDLYQDCPQTNRSPSHAFASHHRNCLARF
jgi:hypothetical protein